MSDQGTGLLVVTDSDDALASGLVMWARKRELSVTEIDLRTVRPSIRIQGGTARVHLGLRSTSPAVVLNRTTISSLGMPSRDATDRRSTMTFDRRYAAAREEQGLMLAAFAIWASTGSRVISPVSASDTYLRPELARRWLSEDEISMGSTGGPQILVAGGEIMRAVSNGSVVDLSPPTAATALRAARRLGIAALGRIDMAPGDEQAEIAGWHPLPLRRGPVSPDIIAATARALELHLLDTDRSDEGIELFVPDIATDLRGVPDSPPSASAEQPPANGQRSQESRSRPTP